MPKKTTILIVILALITGVLIFLAVKSDQTQDLVGNVLKQNQTSPTPTVVAAYADLSFLPALVDFSEGDATRTVNIVIDTHGKPVSGAQIELSYDPKVISGVAIRQPIENPFFGANPLVLINSIDAAQGRISYAVGISSQDSEKTGTGSIATLTFTANKFAGVSATKISYLTKSAVTTLTAQKSVLNTMLPLQIKLGN